MLYCKFCGAQLDEEGKCPNDHSFKKMCINCEFCGESEPDEETGKKNLVCLNEENKAAALDKMLNLLKENGGGYSVKALEIEPVPLKKVTLKCGKWSLSEDAKEEVLALFK